jgi:hypothetical protein
LVVDVADGSQCNGVGDDDDDADVVDFSERLALGTLTVV